MVGGGFVLVGGGVGGLVGPVGSVTQENSWQIFPPLPQLSPTKEQAGSFPAAHASACKGGSLEHEKTVTILWQPAAASHVSDPGQLASLGVEKQLPPEQLSSVN